MPEELRVVVVSELGEQCRRQIAAVDSRLSIVHVAPFLGEQGSLRLGPPPWEVLLATGNPADAGTALELRQEFALADVMLGMVVVRDFKRHTPRLRWVQLVSAGVDYLPLTGLLDTDVTVTTAQGCFDVPISEWVVSAILMHAKGVLRCMANKRAGRWERFTPSSPQGQTLGILGLGSVGAEVARRARGLSMKLAAYDRYVGAERAAELGVQLVPFAELMSTSDYLAVTLPPTQDRACVVGARELAMMKPTACLINASGGSVVDEAALVEALRAGGIAAAALA